MTDAPVDLDELEARMCGTLTYAELRGFVAALIAELRAARAVSQEASGHSKCQRDEAGDCVAHAEEDPACLMNAPPTDHEPFAPMECCGRDRDKDGGPNPHCECPAPVVVHPTFGELAAELKRLKRKVRGVKAPCRQCGDTLAKCMSQPGLCCIGCNHATGATE